VVRVVLPGIAILCGIWLAGCNAVLQKPFLPTTPDEQAVVRTVEAFLAAARAQDTDTIARLLLPEATIERVVDGIPVANGRYRAGPAAEPLPADVARLVNFRQLTADRVAVETYIVTYLEKMTQVTHLRWDLVRHERMWRVLTLNDTSWTRPDHAIVYGAGS
jgi:hypothetical protein